MRSLILIAAVAIAASSAAAQTATTAAAFPRPGTRVRVVDATRDTVVGIVTRRSTDSLWLDDRRFARQQIVAVSTYNRNRGEGARRGLLIGGGIGLAAIGAGIVADANAPPCDFICIPATAVAGVFAIMSTGVGAAAGALIGPREWKPVR